MNRKPQGCCSGCGGCLLWAVVLVLLADGWVGSSWPLRAVELLALVILGVVSLTVQRRGRRKA